MQAQAATSPCEPLERRTYEAARLFAETPPVLCNANKLAVYEAACPPGSVHSGQVTYTRWQAMPLPQRLVLANAPARLIARDGIYDYVPVSDVPGAVEWHVNFADPELFVAYGSGLFAQDEMQVAEHPVLGALREKLRAEGLSTRTQEGGEATPILVRGVERRCRVHIGANPAAGRPRGLYGNAFAAASLEAVRAATERLEPPTISNIIAIAAPAGGYGKYSPAEIRQILTTAFTGFEAARLESGGAPVVVHTGFWGCGAFGGNRVLMAVLQFIAAEMAALDRLVFHTVNAAGMEPLEKAVEVLGRFERSEGMPTSELVASIERLGFEWGVSDGN